MKACTICLTADNFDGNICEGCVAAMAHERARIVAWLRSTPSAVRVDANTVYGSYQDAADMLADSIERGEHLAHVDNLASHADEEGDAASEKE